jgi:hypothetical protein
MQHLRWPFIVVLSGVFFGGVLSAGEDLTQDARDFIAAAVKKDIRQTERPGTGRVKLNGADANGIVAEAQGMSLSLPWKALGEKELYGLTRGLLQKDDAIGHALVTRLALKLGKGVEMEKALDNLLVENPAAAETVNALRAEIEAAKPKAPAPVKIAETPAAGGAPANAKADALPKITAPVMFNTPEADAILSRVQFLPPDHVLRMDISKLPVLSNSDRMIARIGADKSVHHNSDMGFIIVPPNQARVPVELKWAGESEKGPYPVPDNAPIEGWPMDGPKDLAALQAAGSGDRHMFVLDPAERTLWEFYRAFKTPNGWKADCAARFDLATWKPRPRGWTSADASGMSVLVLTPRFDECERGEVNHAIRVTVPESRQGWIFPASHQATRNTDADLPAMGQRFRLKASVDISKFPKHAQAIARAMQLHGLILADHGSAWYISTTPDDRLKGLQTLGRLKGSDFEVVQMPAHPEDRLK